MGGQWLSSYFLVTTAMTQIADIEVSRGNAKPASGILLLLGILLFLNYGVAKLSDLLAFQMWPSHVDMAIFIVFGSAVLYVVLTSALE